MTPKDHVCHRCGTALQVLHKPVRRLRGTRFRWRAFVSLFTRALLVCPACGAVHTGDGELLAAGLVETEDEVVLRQYRDDMRNMRDSFTAIVIGADISVLYMILGPQSFPVAAPVLAGLIGVLALVPFSAFATRARAANKELKAIREARLRGESVASRPALGPTNP